MKRSIRALGVLVLVLGVWAGAATAQIASKPSRNQEDPMALGQPLSYWLTVIQGDDLEQTEKAFAAIMELGSAAWKAVPELTDIVAKPFVPIRMGTDDPRDVLLKLLDIHLRAGAVDSLGSIGEAAASATRSVIEWALTIRVLPSDVRTPDDASYIELIGMDVLERMRGAGAAAHFGPRAAAAVQELMESRDDEKIKLAIAILNEGSLDIATALMRSESCRDQMLGLKILIDMWPVVASDHLKALKNILPCSADSSGDGTGPDSVRKRSRKQPLRLN
jgi:hypothetical protein